MAAVKAMPAAERDAAIRNMVAGLDRRLAAKGGSVDDWLRLVRSYSVLGERDARSRPSTGPDGTEPRCRAIERLDELAGNSGCARKLLTRNGPDTPIGEASTGLGRRRNPELWPHPGRSPL